MIIDKKTLINWIGDKKLLINAIAPLITTYIIYHLEVFSGVAWIFFSKING